MLGVGQVIFTFVFVNDGKFFTLVDIHFQVSAYEKHRLKIIACVTGSLQVLKCAIGHVSKCCRYVMTRL